MATHVPQSLPSFAQAFSNTSLSSIPTGNSLPPIQSLSPSSRRFSPRTSPALSDNSAARKRSRTDDEPSNSSQSGLHSPKVKEELDMLDSTPPPAKVPRLTKPRGSRDSTNGALAHSGVSPNPSKKRRMTIGDGGVPHPLNTDVGPSSADQASSTPISPVVMGFTIMRDDPAAIEQVRSMLNVKQKQKALIEQRRGSTAGLMSNSNPGQGGGNGHPAGAVAPLVPGDRDRDTSALKGPAPATRSRRSPNPAGVSGGGRRGSIALSGPGIVVPSHPRPPSPSPMIVPSQAPPSQSLPPPPISFARRRAGQLGSGKRKPADIVISPREAYTAEQFQPSIQSAPPIPHAGQCSSKFPMTLPRLPSVMDGGEAIRRVSIAQVPPTPTRFSIRGGGAGTSTATTSVSGHLAPPRSAGLPRKSPPASVPISNNLVPPTPSSLHHPGYSGDKSAFLAPFEIFYDALNDSKTLKNWLGEQLHRSNALMQTLTQQQERMEEVVERLVERKTRGYREEIGGLQRRVEQLEGALRTAGAGDAIIRRHSVDVKGKNPVRNGIPPGPVAPETYTFPPVEQHQMRPERETLGGPESESGSPAPFDVHRRMSTSAIRLDPPRQPPESSSSRQLQSLGPGHGNRLHPPARSSDASSSPRLTTSSAHTSHPRPQTDRPILHREHSHGRSYKVHPRNPSDSSISPKLGVEGVGHSPKLSNHHRRESVAAKSTSPPGSVMDDS